MGAGDGHVEPKSAVRVRVRVGAIIVDRVSRYTSTSSARLKHAGENTREYMRRKGLIVLKFTMYE